jgi:3-keto-disaccharide hydrolase
MKAILLVLVGVLTAPARQESKSALESDPNGWTDLFPDKELKGWSRVVVDPKATQKVFSVSEDGKLLQVDGRGGVLEVFLNEKEYTDGVYHVEWRWGKDQGEKPNYNGGVYVRAAADGKTWIQAQVARGAKPPAVGDLIKMIPVDGKPQRVDVLQKGSSREAAVGEWNTYEITCKGKSVSLWVNGAVTAALDDCPLPKGRVGLQAEFALYEVRSLRFKPLP